MVGQVVGRQQQGVSPLLARLPQPGAYAKGWRRLADMAKANPGARVKDPFDEFGRSMPAAELLRKVRAAMDRRINTRGGDEEANQPIDIGWYRDQRALRDIANRVRFYRFERPEVMAMFGDRLAERGEV